MASLQLSPLPALSKKAVPPAIQKAVKQIFSQKIEGLWLVGGTAIAGYYAEHRRSDDIDLFVQNSRSFEMTYQRVMSLKKKGALFTNEFHTPTYYRSLVTWLSHSFTIDIVLDENLFQISQGILTNDGVYLADAETLLAMKIACLVSRCSEKDLFDLDWFFSKLASWNVQELIARGEKIDAGLNTESLLISLKGTMLRKEACHFLLRRSHLTVNDVYKKITTLQKQLINKLVEYEQTTPLSEEGKALKDSLKDMKK